MNFFLEFSLLLTLMEIFSLIASEVMSLLLGYNQTIFHLFEGKQYRKFSKIADESTIPEIKQSAIDELDAIAYKQTTGIITNKFLQIEIIKYYKLAKNRLDYQDFRHAIAFLNIDIYGNLAIRKLSFIDYALQFYWLLMVINNLLSISCYLIYFPDLQLSTTNHIILSINIFLQLLLIFILYNKAKAVGSAKKIANIIAER